MFTVVCAFLLLALAGAIGIITKLVLKPDKRASWIKIGVRAVGIPVALFLLASTSYISVGSNEVAVLNKIYGGTSLSGEHILATKGEKGPQAEILTPGFHPWLLVNVLYEVTKSEQIVVPAGHFGVLTAKDGEPLRENQFLAEQFPSDHFMDMLDAAYFLEHHGQRGTQASILPPGTYRVNKYLFDVDTTPEATDIGEGEVGVVKSNIVGSVNFGSLEAKKPDSCVQKTVSTSTTGDTIQAQSTDSGKLTAILVPVGCIGVWETALQPGRYYINPHAYTVVKISTRVQTLEFKGGYRKRYIDLSVDQAGQLKQVERSEDIAKPDGSADVAITPRIEGWVVPLELRVLAQVTPENAPFVVAAVGNLDDVEHRIMIPTIRSIVRNVVGADGRKVLDLMDKRAEVEQLTEQAIRPEGLKAGIVIKEVRFGDPVLPPELLVSRLRQQLADQLKETYKQEQAAQEQRIATEQARATAEQQGQLVTSQIGVLKAKQDAEAARLRGEGQKLELEQVAEGQRAQALVLGQDRVVTITIVDKVLAAIKDKPEIVSLIGKLVPQTVVTTGGGSNGLDGAAAIFGALLHSNEAPQALAVPAPATKP